MMSLITSLFLLFFVQVEAADLTEIEHLKLMTKGYSSTPYLQAKFKQKQIMELLGETKSSKGELYYSSQKLRVELEGEQNSVTLFTPGVITSITYDEKQKPVQVLRSKPYPHPLLSLMFGNEDTWDDFKITKTKKNTKSILEVEVKPKNPKELPGIERIEIILNKKKNEIQKITYWDDIGNQTSNEFMSQKKKDKVDGTQFILIPPAGVEVRNL
jgi:outer membrane lipoprotein-sorting protein